MADRILQTKPQCERNNREGIGVWLLVRWKYTQHHPFAAGVPSKKQKTAMALSTGDLARQCGLMHVQKTAEPWNVLLFRNRK